MQTVKLHLNSVISDVNASYLLADINFLNLNIPINRFEYMRIPVKHILDDIMSQYALQSLVINSYVLVEIRKGMYGLPQTGLISQKRLNAHLLKFGYTKYEHTSGLYAHTTRATTFTLVVDNFGIKYCSTDDAIHLLTCLRALYEITTDWTGSLYIGFTLQWNYKKRWVELSIPSYIEKSLIRFCIPLLAKPQHLPYDWLPPSYGAKVQNTQSPNTYSFLDADDRYRIQEVVGVLLYHTRALISPTLASLSDTGADQVQSTTNATEATTKLLNYCATYPNLTLRFIASDMNLRVCSDASYLSVSKSRSRVASYFYLSSIMPSILPLKAPLYPPLNQT